MKRQLRKVRKYTGGGLGDLADRSIPKAQVEIYLRSRESETFYVPTLADGLIHLMSTKGYRLGISYWPDGAGFNKPEYKIRIWRIGNTLHCDVLTPFLRDSRDWDTIEWNLNREVQLPPEGATIEVVDLGTVLGLLEKSETVETQTEDSDEFVDRIEATLGDPTAPTQQESSLFEEEEVVINGTQLYFPE